MSCCWVLDVPVGEEAAGAGAGEEAGASGTDPVLLPVVGAVVLDIPKDPRLQAGGPKRWEETLKKGENIRGWRACRSREGTGLETRRLRNERQRGGRREADGQPDLAVCLPPPSPGYQAGGLSLQGLQTLLDL